MKGYVYQPAEDSELLLEAVIKELKPSDTVLEVGTGSGFIAKNLAGKCRRIVATDISPFAVKEAKRWGIDVIRTDLFLGLKRIFTLVIFNPPYLELEDWEKKNDWIDVAIDGGRGGIETAVRFLSRLDEVMVDCGRAMLVLSSISDNSAFRRACSDLGYTADVVLRRRLFLEELYVYRVERKIKIHK